MDLITILKALSHENRLRILNLIKEQDLCVCELQYIMDINQSNASRHLNKLKQADLIYGKRKAQWIYYQINPQIIEEYNFLNDIIEHELKEVSICKKDNEKLLEYQNSELSCQDLD